ncbi:hypothetical protein VTJ04DRAFT_1724 [Mycothermus thermophilus]|uniref:uncharacterized protein n=1 Tax=Humicola insolens TaxID=85995 RepID=UPI003741EBB6
MPSLLSLPHNLKPDFPGSQPCLTNDDGQHSISTAILCTAPERSTKTKLPFLIDRYQHFSKTTTKPKGPSQRERIRSRLSTRTKPAASKMHHSIACLLLAVGGAVGVAVPVPADWEQKPLGSLATVSNMTQHDMSCAETYGVGWKQCGGPVCSTQAIETRRRFADGRSRQANRAIIQISVMYVFDTPSRRTKPIPPTDHHLVML